MKLKSTVFNIILPFAFLLLIFTGCIKDKFDTPPLTIPTVNFTANTTIESLTNMYTGTLASINDGIIISGVVSANDESGNYYKAFILQDETGGIEVDIDQADLYTTYGLGQKVFIKCQGMYLGEYYGLLQLGYSVNSTIGNLPATLISSHIYPESLPGKNVQPVTLTIPELSNRYISCLVKLDSVHFIEAGQMFAVQTSSGTNRTIVDNNGNTLTLRTSKYASFASNAMPAGNFDLMGILSIYNSEYELYIRDLNDIVKYK